MFIVAPIVCGGFVFGPVLSVPSMLVIIYSCLVAFLLLSSCCLVAVYGALGWFAVCDCGTCISWSDSLFCHFICITIKIDQLFYVSG